MNRHSKNLSNYPELLDHYSQFFLLIDLLFRVWLKKQFYSKCKLLSQAKFIALTIHSFEKDFYMSKLQELIAQQKVLVQQIDEERKIELSGAISKVRAIVTEFNLTSEQVFPKAKSVAKTGKIKSPAKFKDPVTGKTWNGNGMAPRWLAGKDRSEFAIS